MEDRVDHKGWVRPSHLLLHELRWYRDQYDIGVEENQHIRSYENHYRGAHRGNRISIERMDWITGRIALARMRGER